MYILSTHVFYTFNIFKWEENACQQTNSSYVLANIGAISGSSLKMLKHACLCIKNGFTNLTQGLGHVKTEIYVRTERTMSLLKGKWNKCFHLATNCPWCQDFNSNYTLWEMRVSHCTRHYKVHEIVFLFKIFNSKNLCPIHENRLLSSVLIFRFTTQWCSNMIWLSI